MVLAVLGLIEIRNKIQRSLNFVPKLKRAFARKALNDKHVIFVQFRCNGDETEQNKSLIVLPLAYPFLAGEFGAFV